MVTSGLNPETIDKYRQVSTAYNLLMSYLANREQFVELNDTSSKTVQIVAGVAQGSILGPLLFF